MKRLFLCFSCLALVASLCACDGTGPTGGATTADASTTAAAETTGAPVAKEAVNNGGRYVKYGGGVYYWEYTADCLEPSVIWGEFEDVPGARRPLTRLDADGQTQPLFTEDGSGGIWISKDRLYLTRLDDSYEPYIFSVSMEGKDRRELGPGDIFALDEARGLLLATVREYVDHRAQYSVWAIDMQSGRKQLHAADVVPLLYDAPSATLYCQDTSGEEEGVVQLRAVDITTGKARDVARIDAARFDGEYRYNELECQNPWLDGDSLHLCLAGYNGNAHMLSGGTALAVDLAGGGVAEKENPDPSDWFGVNRPFHRHSDGPFMSEDGDPWYWDICPGQGKAPKTVLSEQDLDGLGLPDGPFFGEEDYAGVRDVEYVDGALFFTITRGPRNPSADIGWRQAYGLESLRAYRKDLATGKIAQLYACAFSSFQFHN
ncbi:MAG: hypothetical protein LBB75_05525 [Oscillospiraceae bacterium]|jgi:hypothetical protein|nr:hypothetical protein [Oscillospiraceae bacterium]